MSSLRATENIHKDIEDFFLTKGFFYDRRKNYYKNNGKPKNQIIAITYLAQGIMSIVLQEPDFARARPGNLLKDNSNYKKVFNPKHPINLYLNCVRLTKIVEKELKNPTYGLSRPQIGDIKFHCALYVTALHLKSKKPSIDQIANLNVDLTGREIIKKSIEEVIVLYDSLGGTNAVAKGKELVKELKELIDENYLLP